MKKQCQNHVRKMNAKNIGNPQHWGSKESQNPLKNNKKR
jgi:hypothetical protein